MTAAKVPARVIVPLAVMGPPLVVRPVVPPETSTLVTVPELPADPQAGTPAVTVNTWDVVPMASFASVLAPLAYMISPAA